MVRPARKASGGVATSTTTKGLLVTPVTPVPLTPTLPFPGYQRGAEVHTPPEAYRSAFYRFRSGLACEGRDKARRQRIARIKTCTTRPKACLQNMLVGGLRNTRCSGMTVVPKLYLISIGAIGSLGDVQRYGRRQVLPGVDGCAAGER
jgi:hypothetical protein